MTAPQTEKLPRAAWRVFPCGATVETATGQCLRWATRRVTFEDGAVEHYCTRHAPDYIPASVRRQIKMVAQ
jgi:hypothetical protein